MSRARRKPEPKTEFSFDELSDRAKEHARDKYREELPWDENDWDYVYEDATRLGALMGIEIGARSFQTVGGKSRSEPDIDHAGFCQQGDGASFAGTYRYEPDAVKKIENETVDSPLLIIAAELTALQVAVKIEHGCTLSATITKDRGHYCHSGSMAVEARLDVDDLDVTSGEDETLTSLMRDFADWIYKQLEAEYDYRRSDEAVDERLQDGLMFDEDGDTI